MLEVAMAPQEIGQRIKAARERKHWTQQGFALEANVSISTVSRWERGELPPVRELIRIADILEIDPEQLMEPPQPPPDELRERLTRIEALLEGVAARLGQEEPGREEHVG